MFIRDELTLDYLAGAMLLTFPWLGIAWGTWGLIWEILMMLAVLVVGRRRGLPLTSVFLLLGYVAVFIVYGTAAYNELSFVPLAGLLCVFGWQRKWSGRVTFFWSAALAAVLGVIPTLSFLTQGADSKTMSDMINMIVQQYQTSGLLAIMQQQGTTEVQIRDLLQQLIQFYILIIPSFAAIAAFVEFGLAFYLVRRLFKDDKGYTPFTRWRLPWYTVWGVILGIIFYLLGDQFSWTVLRVMGINLMVVFGLVTLILGISVFIFMIKSPKIPRFLKVMLVISVFLYFSFTIASIMMFGLFDLVFNFRRLPEEV